MTNRLTNLFNLLLFIASVSLVIAAPTAEIDCTVISCCELTEEELTACSSISEKCPGYSGIGALGPEGECDECPPGECRVGNSCVCPADFLDSKSGDGFQKLCKDQYGKAWPKSIGRENKLCTSEEETAEEEEAAVPGLVEEEEEIAKEEAEMAAEEEATAVPIAEAPVKAKHNSTFAREMSNVVQYIRKESGNGTNVVGMLSTGVLVISIIAACCCYFTRRR